MYDLYPISGMILSSAMSPSAKVCDQAYDIPRLNKYFDFVSIMTYDYHGQWDKKTGHVRCLLLEYHIVAGRNTCYYFAL